MAIISKATLQHCFRNRIIKRRLNLIVLLCKTFFSTQLNYLKCPGYKRWFNHVPCTMKPYVSEDGSFKVKKAVIIRVPLWIYKTRSLPHGNHHHHTSCRNLQPTQRSDQVLLLRGVLQWWVMVNLLLVLLFNMPDCSWFFVEGDVILNLLNDATT